MDKDNKKYKEAEQSISIFARAFACLVKCSDVSMGIDTKNQRLVVRDNKTTITGEVKLEDINSAISQEYEQKPQLGKVRQIIETVRSIAPHLNIIESDLLLLVLMSALDRLEKEAEQDDIHNISK